MEKTKLRGVTVGVNRKVSRGTEQNNKATQPATSGVPEAGTLHVGRIT
jgi:hypothetical protein